jgi:predicted nuclease of predicted toxin-antitoxin system
MFLFDECVDKGIIEILFKLHIDNNLSEVFDESISHKGLDFFQDLIKEGATDVEVLNIAFLNSLILITEDKDFGELAFRLKYPHCGIVLIRIIDLPRQERISLAANTIFEYRNELKYNFSVITNEGIKIKKS